MAQQHTEVNCCEEVWSSGAFRSYQCTRRGVVEREGRLYCKQHDPEAVKARQEASNAKWQAEQDAKTKQWKYERACIQAFAGTSGDPETLLGNLVEAARSMLAQYSGDFSKKTCGHDFFCVCPGDELRAALSPFAGKKETQGG